MKTERLSRAALALLALWPLIAAWNPLDRPNRAVESGNASMQKGKAEEALSHYDEAVAALPNDPGVHFNRGTALMALSRYEEAIAELMRATEAKTPSLKAAAFYNLGNAYFKSDRFADAIAAYKRSLALEPGDMRAKWNLELAIQKKQEQDKKDQDKNKDDKNKDDQKRGDKNKQDDQKQEQDKKDQDEKKDDQDKQDKTKQDDQKQDDQKQEEKPQEEQPSPQDDKASEMSEINAVLDSLERSPKDLEKMRARLRAVRRAPPEKDW